jgi:hypothetical protein
MRDGIARLFHGLILAAVIVGGGCGKSEPSNTDNGSAADEPAELIVAVIAARQTRSP